MSRSLNFSNSEIEIILNEMEEYPELVSKEFTSRFPGKKDHRNHWELLATKLSAMNTGVQRTGHQVKNKWNDLKYRVKQKTIKLKKYRNGTDGGPAVLDDLLPYEQRIIGIIGSRCTQGITNESFDTSTLILQKLKKTNTTIALSQTEQSEKAAINESDAATIALSQTVKSEEDAMNESDTPIITLSQTLQSEKADLNESDTATIALSQTVKSEKDAINESDTAIIALSQTLQSEKAVINESDTATIALSQTVQSEEAAINESDTVIHEVEMLNVSSLSEAAFDVHENIQEMPNISWPKHQTKNSSTLRGQKHREIKRKRAVSQLENFETEALATQKQMCRQMQILSEAVSVQRDDVTDIKNAAHINTVLLESINKNLENLVKKLDENNKLLCLVLNKDDI